ncbi:MAG: 2-C-methyl-D-erythritol 4-phosphate cytidylyltransferase [bacterium]|nr:2-C-methyl-D-erythritol 4-phosphate cytidylyltransferase [bacterium]
MTAHCQSDTFIQPRLSVIITAAGQSRRMGVNKLLLSLGGKPILAHACAAFNSLKMVSDIVVTAPSGLEAEYEELLRHNGIDKLSRVVTGGAERQDSIYEAMRTLQAGEKDFVAVHDAARPLISVKLIETICAELSSCDGAIPAVAVKDTIKRVDASGTVLETLKRSELRAVQTPQIFRYGPLRRAYESAYKENFLGTDDASLIERYGGMVRIVEGDYRNIKITTAEDLAILEKFWAESNS